MKKTPTKGRTAPPKQAVPKDLLAEVRGGTLVINGNNEEDKHKTTG